MGRAEREKWIQENEEKEKKKKRVTENEEDEEEDQDDSQFFNMASKALKKLKRRTSMNTNETSSVSNPLPESKLQQKIFKSPKVAKPLQILSGNQKGSFLSRESGTLEKLAEMTRGKSEAKTGSTAKNTNNFVFAAVSPPPKAGKNNEQAETASVAQSKRKSKSKNN